MMSIYTQIRPDEHRPGGTVAVVGDDHLLRYADTFIAVYINFEFVQIVYITEYHSCACSVCCSSVSNDTQRAYNHQ
jgi:hypothetical protein